MYKSHSHRSLLVRPLSGTKGLEGLAHLLRHLPPQERHDSEVIVQMKKPVKSTPHSTMGLTGQHVHMLCNYIQYQQTSMNKVWCQQQHLRPGLTSPLTLLRAVSRSCSSSSSNSCREVDTLAPIPSLTKEAWYTGHALDKLHVYTHICVYYLHTYNIVTYVL